MTIGDMSAHEHDAYYWRYIQKLSTSLELIDGFKMGLEDTFRFFQSIPEERQHYRYEKGKWTIKEVLQHLIDAERIFIYRCFRIARRDTTSLAGFNQEIYIEPSAANAKRMDQLLAEYLTGREQSISILQSITDEDLVFIGNANQAPMSARAAAFTIIGHDIWHMEIIKERYL